MKKLICLALALILCIGLLVGCGSKEETTAPDDGTSIAQQTTGAEVGQLNTSGSSTSGSVATPPPAESKFADKVVKLLDSQVTLINPFNPGGRTQAQGDVYHMMYDTFVTWTIDGQYVPCLATEWSSDDMITWNFKLRDDVTFHNGEHFTADDVVFTYEYALANAAGTGLYDRCTKFESLKALGDYEVEIKLKALNPDFIDDMSSIVGFVVCNREASEADPENGPMIGTGPYYVDDFKTSEYIIYKRWDKYFDADKTITDTVEFRYVAEETARMIMLDNGEADFGVVTSVYIPQYANNPDFNLISYAVNNCGYVALNCSREPMDDINFRWACAYAVSRDEIVDVGFSGFSVKHPNGVLWGLTTEYFNPDIPDIEQDVEKAKEFLAKSKYDGRTIQIYAAMSHTKRIAAVVMSQFNAVGIKAEVVEVDGPTLTMRSSWDNNDMDIIVNSNVFGPTPVSARYLVEKSDNNKAKYVNERAIECSDLGQITPDGPEREALYFELQQILFDEQPYIPTTHNALYVCGQKGTGGVLYYPNGYNDYATSYRIIED